MRDLFVMLSLSSASIVSVVTTVCASHVMEVSNILMLAASGKLAENGKVFVVVLLTADGEFLLFLYRIL